MSFRSLHVPGPGAEPAPPDLSGLATALDPIEVRVLGALMEKEVVTPDNYPLSLNSLLAACNQKTSRDPVVDYDEDTVRDALDRLRRRGLARVITGADNRVPKYRQTLTSALRLTAAQHAALTVLLLRGAQTVGEIKDRAQRLHDFASLDDTLSALDSLMQFPQQPLVVRLERAPGTKEPRYHHLLAGMPELSPASGDAPPPARPKLEERMEIIERELADLKAEVRRLTEQWEQMLR